MEKEIRVTFQPSGRTVHVLPGTILLEAAARAGYIIETPCGGGGTCGKCLVRVTSGTCKACANIAKIVGKERVQQGYRLACQCRAESDLVVEVPESSLFQSAHKILSSDSGDQIEVRPSVTKHFLDLTPPDRENCASDLDRLKEKAGSVEVGISTLRSLPRVLREADFKVTVTTVDREIVAIEPGNTASACYGLAFDIGTTTLVGTLVDLMTGADLGVASRVNPQTSFGDDVVSRIKRCIDDPDGLANLNRVILDAVNSMTAELSEKAAVRPLHICEAVFAGNSTMQEILAGIHPMSLGELPFVTAFRDLLSLSAADLGLKILPEARVYLLPQIGGFVGGDTVAGVIATRLDQLPKPALLVDVGTNGEIVLAHKGKMTATSVAAGPAFEGARIVNGMRASAGAIEKVIVDGDIRINVIGNVRPAGLCGTALIDTVAELLRLGILDMTGRLVGPDEAPAKLPDAIRKRIVRDDGQFNFELVHASESATGEPLYLYQKDIRELQLANGAIRAGIGILLQREGLQPSDLGSVLLAGAFGNFIRRNNALRIGMLPPIHTDHIRFVGNTASFGAKRALLSSAEKEYANRVARETHHLDLSLSPEFQSEFSAAMLFPEDEPS